MPPHKQQDKGVCIPLHQSLHILSDSACLSVAGCFHPWKKGGLTNSKGSRPILQQPHAWVSCAVSTCGLLAERVSESSCSGLTETSGCCRINLKLLLMTERNRFLFTDSSAACSRCSALASRYMATFLSFLLCVSVWFNSVPMSASHSLCEVHYKQQEQQQQRRKKKAL